MRRLPMLLLLGAAPAMAQTGSVPSAGTPLTIHYPAAAAGVEIITRPRLNVVCSPPSAADRRKGQVICRANTTARTVAIQVTRKPPPDYPFLAAYVAGNQWDGACEGTRGTTCTLDLREPRDVGVNFDGG